MNRRQVFRMPPVAAAQEEARRTIKNIPVIMASGTARYRHAEVRLPTRAARFFDFSEPRT